jgi:hypothetical protein
MHLLRHGSDIDTAVVDSLKVLDPKRPIREADIDRRLSNFRCSRESLESSSSRVVVVCPLKSGPP